MKKKILSVLLCLATLLALLPQAALAEAIKLNSVDVVIDLPKAGDSHEADPEINITSFKSGDIDLLSKGAGFLSCQWYGDDDLNEDYEISFRAGTTYYVYIKLAIPPESGYCANYKVLNGEHVVDSDTFSATINGVPAIVTTSAQHYPALQVSLTIEGERMNEQQKAELTAKQENYAKNVAKARRAVFPSRTWAEASEYNLENIPEKVVTATVSPTQTEYKLNRATTLIIDLDDAELMAAKVTNNDSLREVWLSDKTDPYSFIHSMEDSMRSLVGGYYFFERRSDLPFYTAEATLYIPESSVPSLIDSLENKVSCAIPYTIKAYSGNDVYAAQKAGASAAKEWCTNHKYTGQLRTADRVYTYSTCGNNQLYYYSCAICGKCEYNPNHVYFSFVIPDFEVERDKLRRNIHNCLDAEIPNESAYIGVNAAGMHIYWLSCEHCGKSRRYFAQNISNDEYNLLKPGVSFSKYQEQQSAEIKRQETLALNSDLVQPEMFAVRFKNTANVSSWAESDVNLALNDNLLDTNLLGGDYTKNISRLQFCSVAVRLAEELTGKSITPASGDTFSDTTDSYVLKAYATGITSGTSATTFSPDATLNRQQMATFIYNTLRYVEKNSEYKYTTYNSKLDSYTDKAQIADWATEAMAFMNALDLIKGNTDTTLNPGGLCTIEQAVAVAERSVYAHQIGWYQVVKNEFVVNSKFDPEDTDDYMASLYTYANAAFETNASYHFGDYVWVTGKRMGVYNTFEEEYITMRDTYHSVINPYTHQQMYIFNSCLRPIRD